jgi:hypothetical protein
MTLRTRKYVALAVTIVIAVAYGRLAADWSAAAYYGGAAALLVVVCAVALPWMEFARDGAFRRRPEA